MSPARTGKGNSTTPSATGLCLPQTYLWGAVILTIFVMVVTVMLIIRGQEPVTAITVMAGIGVVAADLIRRVLGRAPHLI